MSLPASDRGLFKITKADTAYDAVCLMAKSLNKVPTYLGLNRWLCTGILGPFQMDEIRALKEVVLKEVNPALKPQVGNSLLTENKC